MNKIRTIIAKEWAEVFKNRLVLFMVAFLPLFFSALPFITMGILAAVGEDTSALNSSANLTAIYSDLCRNLTDADCLQVYTFTLFTFMFMILPVAIPVTIAAYSIVGEKTTHSLEPLLATPITTEELLSGKALAAAIPAILATWLSFLIYLLGARLMVNDVVFAQIADPMWLLAIFVVGPLLALLAVLFAMMVSSRVSDPRVAEQVSALIILPLVLLFVGQSMGLVLINRQIILLVGLAVFVLDVALLFVNVGLFQRETILTRWK